MKGSTKNGWRVSNKSGAIHAMPGQQSHELSPFMQKLSKMLANYAQKGWAFAILVPIKQ
jgi:hypothetical protein